MGYSKEIFTQPQYINILQCIICTDIAQFPVQCTQCDSLFCDKCQEEHQKSSQTCPYCKQGSLQVKELNRNLKNLMASLQVRCRNEGCNQILNLEKLEQHEAICQYLKVYCKNFGCKKSTFKKDADIHEALCSFRLIDCQICSQTFRQSEFTKHSCVQTLKQQIAGFQEAIERQEKKLDLINQLKQIVQTQNEKLIQLEKDRKTLRDQLSEVQINYQYALSQLQKNSIELEAYKKETQDQLVELNQQVSELRSAVMQIQKQQSEQNSNQKKQQDLYDIIEVSKVEYNEKKPKVAKQVKKDLSANNSREEQKEEKQEAQNSINIAFVELEAEDENQQTKKQASTKQLTPPDRQRPKYQEDNDMVQIKEIKDGKSPRYVKQNLNQKAAPTGQARNQDLEKPIQLKKEIQEAVNKALQNIKKPSSSPIQQEQISQNQQQQLQIPQQQYTTSKSPLKPLLFIDVNMSPGRKDRIIVYPGDTPEELANLFSEKHNLDRYSRDQLVVMIRSQMKDA